jgi:hypothetical protein
MWAFFGKSNHTIRLCEQGMILATANILSRMELSATLAYDDVPRLYYLATKQFHTQTFGYGIATVISTTACFLMCHACLLIL